MFPEDACLLPVATPISKTLGGSLSLLPACRLLAPLVYSRNRQTYALPRKFPGRAGFAAKALQERKLPDLHAAKQQAFSLDSNVFLLTGTPVDSGPCLLRSAHHALWVAQMFCQDMGPGLALSVSALSGHYNIVCTCVEEPSSARSGSS